MKGKSVSKKTAITIASIVVLLIVAIILAVVFLKDRGTTEASVDQLSQNSEQTSQGETDQSAEQQEPTDQVENNENTENNNEEDGEEVTVAQNEQVAEENDDDNDDTTPRRTVTQVTADNTATTATTQTIEEQSVENVDLAWVQTQIPAGSYAFLNGDVVKPQLESVLTAKTYSNVEGVVNLGETVEYTITVKNNSQDLDAKGIIVSNIIPEGTEFISAIDSYMNDGSYDANTRKVTWVIDVNRGETVTLILNVENKIEVGNIVNEAVVDGVTTNQVEVEARDTIAPVYKKLGILNKTHYVEGGDLTYAKEGDEVRVLVSFPEKLAVEPTVKLFGKEYTATYRPASSNPETNTYYYMIDLKMTADMPEGEILFEVYGYADAAGNVGITLNNEAINHEDYPKVTYDITAPELIIKGSDGKDGEKTIGSEGRYSEISFQLHDNFLVKEYEVNGVVSEGLTPAPWSDANYMNIKDLLKEGTNTIILRDMAGNEVSLTFIYDTTAPIHTFAQIKSLTKNVNYAKVGDKVWVYVILNEKLSELPKFTIAGQEGKIVQTEDGSAWNQEWQKYVAEVVMTEDMKEGNIEFTISGYKDLAGNVGEDITGTTDGSFVIFDRTKPVYKNLGIARNKDADDTRDQQYAKEGDSVRVLVSFPEKLDVEPTVKMFGKEYTATYRPDSSNPEANIYFYMADITMTADMPEGEIAFEIDGYTDIAGNAGDPLNNSNINLEAYPRVIYDRTASVTGNVNFPLFILNRDDVNRRQWIRDGEYLRVEANFDEELVENPILTIGTGKKAQTIEFEAKGTLDKKFVYVADIKIDNSILALEDGTQIPFTVTNVIDKAGNTAIYNNDNVTYTDVYGQVTYDNAAPVYDILGIFNDTHYNNGGDVTVATTGDSIRVYLGFKEKLAVEPTVRILGTDTVTELACTFRPDSSNETSFVYMTDFKITDEMNLPEGEVQFEIVGYKDEAGNEGTTLVNKDLNWEKFPKVVYDTVAPEYKAMGIFNWTNNKYGGDVKLATTGEHIRLFVAFPEMLGVNPKVDIYGENGTVTTKELTYSEAAKFYFVEFDTTEDLKLPQGKIQYKIYGYEDAAGNVGRDLTQEDTTDSRYPEVVYDSIAPEYDALGMVNATHYDAKEGNIYYATTGDEIRILVQFDDEKLAVEPKIRVLGENGKVVKEVNMVYADITSANLNTNAYSGQFKITEDMNLSEGQIKFEVYGYEDAAGNVGPVLNNENLKYPSIDQGVVYDKTAPVPHFVSISSTNKNNTYAKVGDQVWVYVAIKEELSKMPVIKINGIETNTIVNDKNEAGTVYVGWIEMTEEMAEGKMTFEISGYEDLAGNIGETIVNKTTDNSSVTFDKTAPGLKELRVQNFYNPTGNQNYSGLTQNPGQNKGIAITVNTTELLGKNPTIVVGGKEFEVPVQEPQFNKYVLYVDLTEDMQLVEGEKIKVTVKGLEDLAGNIGEETTSEGNDNYYVIFDKSAPKYSKLGITNITHYYEEGSDITVAGTGDQVRVLAFFDEKLVTEPRVRVLDANGNMIKDIECPYSDLTSNSVKTNAYLANFKITEDMNLPEGEIKFEVYGYTDAAGNVGETLANGKINYDPYVKVVYDKTAPVYTNLGIARNKDANDTRNQKYAKIGDSIRVLVSFAEKLTTEPKVEMFGKVYDMTYRPDSSNEMAKVYYYMADVDITEDMPEGEIEFEIYGYTDAAGNIGEELTNKSVNDELYTNVIIDNTPPAIAPTEDSISGTEGNYSRIGLTVNDKNGVASYEINNETLILTNGEIVYEKLKDYLNEGSNTVTASDNAGNTANFTFNYDCTPAVRRATNILKYGESNEQSEYYVKPGDKIYMNISFKEKLAHNPTFTLINNGKEYVMDQKLVTAREPNKDGNFDYTVIYEIPENTEFVDGEITLKVSNLEDVYGNKIADENGPTNGHKVFFDKTPPKLQPSYWRKTVEADKEAKFTEDMYPDVVATDNFEGARVEFLNNTVDMGTPGVYKLQYVTTDLAGNKSYNDIFITVVDTTIPGFQTSYWTKTVEANKDIEFTGNLLPEVSATDNATGNIKPELVNNNVDMGTPGTYTLQYVTTDLSGNQAFNDIFITVVDTTIPGFQTSYWTKTVEVNENNPEFPKSLLPEVSATDNANGEVKVELVSNNVDMTKPGVYTLQYTSTDANGNVAWNGITIIVVEKGTLNSDEGE